VLEPGQVVLLVTRVEGDQVALLCGADSESRLPMVALAAGEHPAEAAWRALGDATGLGSEGQLRPFRKLGPRDGIDGWHVFVTSPAEALPETVRSAAGKVYVWRPLATAVAAVTAGGSERWRRELPSLVKE
jgi:hypothetical protein